jgi:hypothetical protein
MEPRMEAAPAWVAELGAWRLSLDSANRYNRNLLQFAAGLAALLGIGGGTGGMVALANAVRRPEGQLMIPPELVVGFLLAFVGIAGILLAGVVIAFLGRWRAEAAASGHLKKLIPLNPDHFLPKAE